MRAGLYIHFPFCLKKCLYCDFNSAAMSGDESGRYVELLLREMELRRAALAEPVTAPTLYFGGGTPSLMAPKLVGRVIDAAGTRTGYALAIGLWSLAATAHGLVRSVFGFGVARFFLGLGEAGNFPAAVKATGEWFPPNERAFA